MPADHGLRPDDLQSGQDAGRQPIQPGKYQTVDAGEGQSLRRFTSRHVKLMAKRQDLYLQRRSRPEQSDQRQPNQAANISHQPRASPNSTPLASRIEFPTMTPSRHKKDCSKASASKSDKHVAVKNSKMSPLDFEAVKEQQREDMTTDYVAKR